MKPMRSNENKSTKTKGEKIVERADKRIKKAHKEGYAVFFGGNSSEASTLKPSLEMNF